MKFQSYAVVAACLISVSTLNGAPGANEAFDRGEHAMAAKDYDTALTAFEEALTQEPDSMRNGSEYRQATIRKAIATHPKEGLPANFDRAISFFEKLTAANPKASMAFLNYGFSYVDKIPAAGSITQVILANNALGFFTKSIDIKPSWIALYTRGNSYLYWPKIFGKAGLGVADLERAYAIQKAEPKRTYHVRVYVSLGDAYWKTDNLEKAHAMWKEGAAQFPDSQPLKDRLSKEGDALKDYIDNVLDPNKRVDTDLHELWMVQ
jgi:tetratricopeptide (TPR) repeat protein